MRVLLAALLLLAGCSTDRLTGLSFPSCSGGLHPAIYIDNSVTPMIQRTMCVTDAQAGEIMAGMLR